MRTPSAGDVDDKELVRTPSAGDVGDKELVETSSAGDLGDKELVRTPNAADVDQFLDFNVPSVMVVVAFPHMRGFWENV